MPQTPDQSVDLSGIDPPSNDPAPTLGFSPSDVAPPVIPRYRIVRLIGVGGMGAVWEAEQEQPRRTVALKVIRPGLLNSNMLRRFEHEVEVLGRLKHPGIAAIYDAGAVETPLGRQPYFAMEHVSGPALHEYVRSAAPSLRERLELFTRICDAVQHAHQQGVIHRDLKPANIVISEFAQPKILDFGVARAIDADIHTTLHTDPGQMVGTLPYMSPEQAGGQAHLLDTRSDVYALGVIAFELLAGQLPYKLTGKPLDEAIRIVREEQQTSLSSIDKNLRGDIETIIGKALEKKDRRYSSVGEFSADVQRFLDYEPITARPPSAWYQMSRFARRNKVLVGGVVAVFLALCFGMAMTAAQFIRARAAERVARQRYSDIRELAGKLTHDLFTQIGALPGSTPAKKLLAETSLRHLIKLQENAGDDPDLLKELAAAYAKVGVVQSNAGDLRGALESYRRWAQISRGLFSAYPSNSRFRRSYAVALMHMGDALSMTGDTAGALHEQRSAMALLQELARAEPENLEAQAELWFAMRYVGDLLTAGGSISEAAEVFGQGLELCRRLAAAEPDNLISQNSLATCHQRIGRVLAHQGNAQAAKSQQLEALAIHERIARAHPHHVELQLGLAASHVEVGDAVRAAGPTAALEHYQTSRQIYEKLTEADPKRIELLLAVSLVHERIGTAMELCGDRAGALESFRVSLKFAERSSGADSSDLLALREVALANSRIGRALDASGDNESAAPFHRHAYKLLHQIAEADPSNRGVQQEAAAVLRDLASATQPTSRIAHP